MVKQRSDEPDDKALERLREFEQKRMPVTGEENDSEEKGKKDSIKNEEKKKDKHDKATDKL